MSTIDWQIVILVMFEPKSPQTLKARTHPYTYSAREPQPCVVQGWSYPVDKLAQVIELVMSLTRAKHGKREKSVAVVEYGCGSGNLVCIIVDEIAKVAHVPVSVEDYGIEEEDIRKPRVGKSLVDGDDANTLRLDPFKPQKFPISMPENHRLNLYANIIAFPLSLVQLPFRRYSFLRP